MKKNWILLPIILFITGCSQFDLNFSKQDESNENNKVEEKVSENKDSVNDTKEKTTSDKNEVSSTNDNNDNNKIQLKSIFFNDIKEVNGRDIIQNPTNLLALVNKENGLPDGYTPKDLVRPKVSFSFGDQDIEKSYLRKEAASALEKMFSEAEKKGIKLFAVSGYRSFDRQTVLFDSEIERVGEKKAIQAVAYPGNSEHQTGLAMDISTESVNFLLTEEFSKTKEGKWLSKNAHRFGYILRYPKGKAGITGYNFEPWHFRYVGEKPASIIYEENLTLEEYFKIVEKI